METQEIAVFVQKINDFMEHTLEYRMDRETNDAVTQSALTSINAKLAAIELTLAKLPCDAHTAMANKVHEGFDKDSVRQWRMIGVLWSAIGAACLSVFCAWLNVRK